MEKTKISLSNEECSRIVDNIDMWLKLLGGVFSLNPATHDQYHDLRDGQIPELRRKWWYVSSPN